MIMRLQWLFAWRYFKAPKSTNAINIIAWVSVGAMAVGTAALILLLSVFNGFEGLVKDLYAHFYADLRIVPKSGKYFTITESQRNQLHQLTEIAGFAEVVEEKALLQYGDQQSLVNLKGVPYHYRDVSGVPGRMLTGQFNVGDSASPYLVMGTGVENALGLASDRSVFPVVVYVARRGSSVLNNPTEGLGVQQLLPTGAFFIQQDFDNNYAFTHLSAIRSLAGAGEQECTAIEIKKKPGVADEELISALQAIVGHQLNVQTRYQQNQSLYGVMQAEKWAIYGVLTLVLLVAAFNMIGALTMLVLEKQPDIALLQALGADQQLIRTIFLREGQLLGIIGGGIGIAIALIFITLQLHFHLITLPGSSFLINYFPVKLLLTDVILVMLTVWVISWLAAYLPAQRAAAKQLTIREA